VVSKRVDVNTGNEYSMFVRTDSHVFADIDGINDRFAGTATISTGVWTQITMVYDGLRSPAERMRIYVNGALDQIGGETSATIPQTHAPLSIGCLPLGGVAQSFVGQLDDVGVWTRALSDAEVAAWYDLTRKGPARPRARTATSWRTTHLGLAAMSWRVGTGPRLTGRQTLPENPVRAAGPRASYS
jgi:hypothetical protein